MLSLNGIILAVLIKLDCIYDMVLSFTQGRVLGITLGCFLGMIPLLFKDDEKKTDSKDK